jgi:arylformamidase
MKKWVMGTVAIGLVAGAGLAQRERLPENCRQQIRELCRMGGGMRQCVMTALPKLSDECRKLIGERAAMRDQPPVGIREIAYGGDPKQRMDLLKPVSAAKAPILFYVHGGGWSIGDKRAGEGKKGPWANGLGWAYVSANYRLVPQATVEQQAADLASALAWLRANAVKEGLDPDRIVLMGHSAGAHLVALLGTDTRYLQRAGVPLAAVRGVVLLDGAGYDIPKQGAAETNLVKPMYDAAFSTDPKRQAALSPTLHAAAPNAGNWLILPVARRQDSQAQSKGLAAALSAAGATAVVHAVPGEGHASLNKGIGDDGDFATDTVAAFLKGVRG